jgi:hypothetical protein
MAFLLQRTYKSTPGSWACTEFSPISYTNFLLERKKDVFPLNQGLRVVNLTYQKTYRMALATNNQPTFWYISGLVAPMLKVPDPPLWDRETPKKVSNTQTPKLNSSIATPFKLCFFGYWNTHIKSHYPLVN